MADEKQMDSLACMDEVKNYVQTQLTGLKWCCFLRESLASLALSGNKLAEQCGETLQRIMNQQAVGERYLLQLAWLLKTLEIKDDPKIKTKRRGQGRAKSGKKCS